MIKKIGEHDRYRNEVYQGKYPIDNQHELAYGSKCLARDWEFAKMGRYRGPWYISDGDFWYFVSGDSMDEIRLANGIDHIAEF